MTIPHFVTRWNRDVLNRVTRHLAGFGPFAEMEHVGRRSGIGRRTPLMAFRTGQAVTIALTYGPKVDWLRNISAAGGARLHLGHSLLTLGAPHAIPTREGLSRMPSGPRHLLPLLRAGDFVELPILAESRFTGWAAAHAPGPPPS